MRIGRRRLLRHATSLEQRRRAEDASKRWSSGRRRGKGVSSIVQRVQNTRDEKFRYRLTEAVGSHQCKHYETDSLMFVKML